LDSLSKKANFKDDSETYFWLLSRKQPRCTLERALGFSKLPCRAEHQKSKIAREQLDTKLRHKIPEHHVSPPSLKVLF
jgi:hypothetical protein